jgi:hypothetical protein
VKVFMTQLVIGGGGGGWCRKLPLLFALGCAGGAAACGRTPLEPSPDDCILSAPKPVRSGTAHFPRTQDTWDGEIASAIDRKSSMHWIYVAAVESTTAPTESPFDGDRCAIEQRVRVYRSQNGENWDDRVSSGLPPTLEERAAQGLPPDPVFAAAGRWETHPSLAIGSDGTVYLAFLETGGTVDCDHHNNPSGPHRPFVDRENELQIWELRPGADAFRKVACDSPNTDGGCDDAATSLVTEGDPEKFGSASEHVLHGFDTPRIAADPTADRLVVTYAVDTDGDETKVFDFLVTLERSDSGAWSRLNPIGSPQQIGLSDMDETWPLSGDGSSFPNPLFDSSGNLVVAQALRQGPEVHVFGSHDALGKWQSVAFGRPPQTDDQTGAVAGEHFIIQPNAVREITTALRLNLTPAMAIDTIDGTETLFLAYPTSTNASGDGTVAPLTGIVLTKTPLSDLQNGWSPLVPIDAARPIAWAPVMSLDPTTSTLDLVYYARPSGATGIVVDTVFERFRPANLHPRSGPTVLTATPLLGADLPRISFEGDFDDLGEFFIGDYPTVVTSGRKAIVGWPEYHGTTSFNTVNADVSLGVVGSVCDDLLTASGPLTVAGRPDTVWECDCTCGGAKSVLTGCASASATTAAEACGQVCIGSDCGAAQSCPPSRTCNPTSSGRAVFPNGCNAAFGPATGGQPSLFADYFANALPDSTADFFDGGNHASTVLDGAIALNVAGGTPMAGAEVEISRLALKPRSFHASGAEIRSIEVVQLERLRGTFMDDRHFEIPAGQNELLLSFVVDPDGPDFITGDPETRHVVTSNSEPMLGTLDLTLGELTLDVSLGTTTGVDGTFHGKLAAAPIDSDGDGIPDAIDNCPTLPNPDQSDAPPVFGAVHDVAGAICAAGDLVTLIPPPVTDACTPNAITVEGALISTNGVAYNPPRSLTSLSVALPIGTTVVEWDAKDGNNHMSTTRQTIQVTPRGPIEVRGAAYLSDRAEVHFADGSFAPVLNSGRLLSQVGVGTKLGDLSSVPGVTVANNARVGAIRSEAGVQLGLGDTVTSVTANTQLTLPDPLDLSSVVFPATNAGDVSVTSSGASLAPGAYANVSVSAGQTLTLESGAYFFSTLELDPDSQLVVEDASAPVALYVQSKLTFQGRIVDASGQNKSVFIGYLGTDDVTFERELRATVVAPRAALHAGAGSDLHFSGSFTAASVELRPDVVFTCDASAVAVGALAPVPASSCTDHVQNGAETAPDCGGYVCAACATGKTCAFGEDCSSRTCSNGLCTATSPITVTTQVTSNWAAGYCVTLNVKNGGTLPTKHWTVRLDTRASTISQSWGGAFSKTSGVLDVTPASTSNQIIRPGTTDTSVGFCANRTVSGSGVLPSVVATGGTF